MENKTTKEDNLSHNSSDQPSAALTVTETPRDNLEMVSSSSNVKPSRAVDTGSGTGGTGW